MNFSFFELHLLDDDPIYTLKKVMEDLDFTCLLSKYSNKGRTGYNPIMMHAVVTYTNVDRIVELCGRDLAFIWLTKGQRPKRDAFYDFKSKKLTGEILDDINYQFLRRLKKKGWSHWRRSILTVQKSKPTSLVFEDELIYICFDGRELRRIRTATKEQDRYSQTFEVYGCEDCSGCMHKARCLYKYNEQKNPDKNKVMKTNEQWEELKEESHANIQSEKGILNRQIRSHPRVSDYVCNSSELPCWILSKCQKPVKVGTLALTGFRHFELDNQAVQRNFLYNLLTQIF